MALGPAPQPPTAESRDVKRAYHSLMRQFHPDRSPENLRDQMASLCVLLNEIYDVSLSARVFVGVMVSWSRGT